MKAASQNSSNTFDSPFDLRFICLILKTSPKVSFSHFIHKTSKLTAYFSYRKCGSSFIVKYDIIDVANRYVSSIS